MAKSYYPQNDSEFATWATNFSTYLIENAPEMQLPIDAAAAIGVEVADFRTNLNSHTTARDTAHSACRLKDETRELMEDAIRRMVRQIQASPVITDAQREAMGLPVHDSARMFSAMAELMQPFGLVDTSNRLRHVIKYRDSASSESRARPQQASGCEIWCATTPAGTPAPAEMAAYRNLGLNSASPFAVEYDMTEAGKNAHYMLRWVSRGGEKGPWSEIISATIVG